MLADSTTPVPVILIITDEKSDIEFQTICDMSCYIAILDPPGSRWIQWNGDDDINRNPRRDKDRMDKGLGFCVASPRCKEWTEGD